MNIDQQGVQERFVLDHTMRELRKLFDMVNSRWLFQLFLVPNFRLENESSIELTGTYDHHASCRMLLQNI